MKKQAFIAVITMFSLVAQPAMAAFPDQEAMMNKAITNFANADSFEYELDVYLETLYDNDETAPLVKHSENIAFADGSVWPGEINELLDSHLPEEDVDTLAGLFIDTLGRLPAKLESIQIEDIKMTILEKDENRILRLRLEKTPPDESDN